MCQLSLIILEVTIVRSGLITTWESQWKGEYALKGSLRNRRHAVW